MNNKHWHPNAHKKGKNHTNIKQTTNIISSVVVATRYGLDGPGIESRWGAGEIFHTSPDRPWGPTHPPIQYVRDLTQGESGRDVVLTTHHHLQYRGLEKGTAISLPALRALVAYKGGTFTFILHNKTSTKTQRTIKTQNTKIF
jgi:hypothetical protein